MPDTKRICLWSTPRNVSTALMYSFAQRRDTVVYDEPLYAHYLFRSRVVHPAKEEILESQENDGNKVVRKLIMGEHEKPVAFFKLMSHFLIDIDESFMEKVINVLLIRDPSEVVHSYSKIIKKPTLK
ncbi:MAG: sulfotransferase family protein, partial [Bacteroidetes bacterium]|nr:sulfotransferase family protein [Bacteroidota bacterium]